MPPYDPGEREAERRRLNARSSNRSQDSAAPSFWDPELSTRTAQATEAWRAAHPDLARQLDAYAERIGGHWWEAALALGIPLTGGALGLGSFGGFGAGTGAAAAGGAAAGGLPSLTGVGYGAGTGVPWAGV